MMGQLEGIELGFEILVSPHGETELISFNTYVCALGKLLIREKLCLYADTKCLNSSITNKS